MTDYTTPRKALRDLAALFIHPDREDSLDAFERIAEEFRKETGLLRPGKSDIMELDTDERQKLRRDAYHTWFNDRIRNAYRVLEENAISAKTPLE